MGAESSLAKALCRRGHAMNGYIALVGDLLRGSNHQAGPAA